MQDGRVAIEADGWSRSKERRLAKVSSTSGKDKLVGWTLGWEDGMGGGSAGHVRVTSQPPASSLQASWVCFSLYLDAIIRYEAVPLALDW